MAQFTSTNDGDGSALIGVVSGFENNADSPACRFQATHGLRSQSIDFVLTCDRTPDFFYSASRRRPRGYFTAQIFL
jgi:hypothetical protein